MPATDDPRPTLYVCFTCGKEKGADATDAANWPGTRLFDALATHIQAHENGTFPVRLQRVKCLGGCAHPCAVAFAGAGKITYMYGDLPTAPDQMDDTVEQISTYARGYAAAPRGYLPPTDKPPLFRPVLVRIPELGFMSETGFVTPPKLPAPQPTQAPDDAPPFASPLRKTSDDA